jgi:hypothetical protein
MFRAGLLIESESAENTDFVLFGQELGLIWKVMNLGSDKYEKIAAETRPRTIQNDAIAMITVANPSSLRGL